LPILFFELANAVGRRLTQLTSLPSGCLKEGHRIEFVSVSCKGRKNEYAKLPKELFEELTALCGPNFLWEHFPAQLNAIYRHRRVGKRAEGFQPKRFAEWLQRQIRRYHKTQQGRLGYRKFTVHNFRDTAMTRAYDLDIPLNKASIAFGCCEDT